MAENLVLAVFVLLPAGFLALLVSAFRDWRRSKKPSRKRTIIGNLGMAGLVVSSIALGGELYFRFVYDTTDSFGVTRTTQRWIERHYILNELGFRDSRDYEFELAEGQTRRVTFVGDSFTAGHGVADVEDRFSNRVRGLLPDWDVQVVCGNGWDTGMERTMLEIFADAGYRLDVVVLVYCLNDISDIVPEWQNALAEIQRHSNPGLLVKNSFLLNTVYFRWQARRSALLGSYFDFVIDHYDGESWLEQQDRLQAFKQSVTDRGGRLAVVTFPFLHAVGGDYPFAVIHERLAEFWKSSDVPALDLLPLFAEESPETIVVNALDAHPNERAHGMAAQSIADFLTSLPD